MRILITGSRKWKKFKYLNQFVRNNRDNFFIFGDCPDGVDNIVWACCAAGQIPYKQFEAKWKQYGLSAGPKRNQEMVDFGADKAYAFRSKGISKGTDDCIRRCEKAEIPIEIISEESCQEN